MFLIILELSFIDITISVFEYTFTVTHIVYELAIIAIPVRKCQYTFTFFLLIEPLAIIMVSVIGLLKDLDWI